MKLAQKEIDENGAHYGTYMGYDNTAYVDKVTPAKYVNESKVDYHYTETWEDYDGRTHFERAYGSITIPDSRLGITRKRR